MDKLKQVNDEIVTEEKPTKNHTKLFAILFSVATLCAIGMGLALWWCLWGHATPTTGTPAPTTAAGPCKDGASNTLPDGYTWYENTTFRYKFAYPAAWGAVTTATAPMGGSAGHYAFGNFASNVDVTFGGNGTDYVVNARDGIPTDNPGFLEATSKFYEVQIWKLNDGSGAPEASYGLHPITDPTTVKIGCNAKAIITQYPFTEFYGYSFDIARVNLQADNLYYGVNFVLKNPTTASRAELDKVLASFELLP